MKFILFVLLFGAFFSTNVYAQYSAQNDAMYIATLKAVVNAKIDDEENLSEIEHLRENKKFNRDLTRMLNKLQNTRTKNSTNRRVYKILLRAGKDVYDELKN